MMVFSKDPDIAEQQMAAIIVYLTTFGYIDGDFDLSEKIFVLDYIRQLVEARVDQAGIDDAMLRLELVNKYTAHFDEIFEQVDNEIRGHFDEVVAGGENVEKFVYAKLKLRCFEIFKSFDEESQRTLLAAIDKLINADGVVKPAEEKARNALGECYPKIPRVTYRSLRIGESEVLAIVIPASPKRPLRANMRETVYPSEIREQGEEAKGLWTLHAGWMEDNRPWESRSEGAASEARRPAAEGLPRSSARRCPLGRSLRLTPR